MSTAVPRSCLKPPVRNPWVAEDGGESSTSSSPQQAPEAALQHGVLAHQYATPFQPSASLASHTSTCLAVTAAPTAVSSWSAPHGHANLHGAAAHGVVHSQTAHSLHASSRSGHSVPSAAHSLHSVPGSLQQPWGDAQFLWSTPQPPSVGGLPGGVFTVGGRNEVPCPGLQPGIYAQHPTHLQPMHHIIAGGGTGSSGQASTSGGWGVASSSHSHQEAGAPPGPVWGVGRGASSGRSGVGSERSRCEKCHHYCFLTAQGVFVTGIVVGFSLLVAGGVFHRRHVAQFQVLVYIGAMVSLVCVVLLVIFCAMSRDNRTRRGGMASFRYPSGPQTMVDSEAVPLRAMDAANPMVVVTREVSHVGEMQNPGEGIDGCQANHSTACISATAMDHRGFYMTPVNPGECAVAAANQNMCIVSPTNHSAANIMNSGPLASRGMATATPSEASLHLGQAKQPTKRAEEERDGSQRYNRLWRQPSKPSSETVSKL